MREIKVDKEFVELLGKVKNHKYIVRSRIWEPKEEGFGRVYFYNAEFRSDITIYMTFHTWENPYIFVKLDMPIESVLKSSPRLTEFVSDFRKYIIFSDM